MKKITLNLITLYQKYLSPDHSFWAKHRFPNGYCQYYPSCSEYTKQSIEAKGFIKGSASGAWRVLRCNPLSRGGVDEVSIKS